MLDVKKRSGKNMIQAANQIRDIVAHAEADVFPQDVNITISKWQKVIILTT